MQDTEHRSSEQDCDFDPIAERFFSQPPEFIGRALGDCEDDWQPEPLSSVERVAMLTTAAPAMALLAVAITLLITEPLLAVPASKGVRAPALVPPEPIARSAPAVVEATAPASPAPVLAPAVAVQAVQPKKVARPAAAMARLRPPSAAKRARRLLDRGDAAGARDLAREAVRTAPHHAAGYIVLAAALDVLGDRAGMAMTFRSCAQLATDRLASACKTLARSR